jgi:hypothetical protein
MELHSKPALSCISLLQKLADGALALEIDLLHEVSQHIWYNE